MYNRSTKPQIEMLRKQPLAYGGELLKTRKGRASGRTLDTKNTIHLVLRSTQATGKWSFTKPQNHVKIKDCFKKYSLKYGVRVQSLACVGNHIHAQIKLSNRYAYHQFIRALTAAIAMAVTGINRWTHKKTIPGRKLKFWDYRPFTRVVIGRNAVMKLKNYIEINRYEGWGFRRDQARFLIEWNSA